MKRTKKLESVAYHEAGHAVVGWHEGLRLDRVTIIPGKEYAGLVEWEGLFKSREDPDLEMTPAMCERMARHARVNLAGIIAQRRYNARSYREHDDFSDRTTVTHLAHSLGGNEEITNAYMRLWDAQTRAVLDLHWSRVEALAEALLEKRELTGDEAVRVMLAVDAPSPPAIKYV